MYTMFKKFIKSFIYVVAFTFISIICAFFINYALAAWIEPTQMPPEGNISLLSPWVDGGSNIYLYTLTDKVGIGTSNPNRQLHIKTNTGNAELDIESEANNYWALYHDATTEQLRFWNADFTGDIGAGVGNAFIIDNDGTILAKTPVNGDSDNVVATKGYVDAAVGGGDATLANQEAIMGSGFASSLNSLKNISDAIKNMPAVAGDATYAKQLEIESLLNNGNWIEANKTFYGVGGFTHFCQEYRVDNAGAVIITNINDGASCRPGEVCNGGVCGGGSAMLSYAGATHSNVDCFNAGGTVFNTGTDGILCKFSASSCPAGWSRADNWQKYAVDHWNNWYDNCNNYTDLAPTVFSNVSSRDCEPGSLVNMEACNVCNASYWSQQNKSDLYCPSSGSRLTTYFYTPICNNDPTKDRIEIGCK